MTAQFSLFDEVDQPAPHAPKVIHQKPSPVVAMVDQSAGRSAVGTHPFAVGDRVTIRPSDSGFGHRWGGKAGTVTEPFAKDLMVTMDGCGSRLRTMPKGLDRHRPIPAGSVATIDGRLWPVVRSIELPSRVVEVTLKVDGGTWWTAHLSRDGSGWRHALYGAVTISHLQESESATEAEPASRQVDNLYAKRDKAARDLAAVAPKSGEPCSEIYMIHLRRLGECQKALYMLGRNLANA